MIPKPQLVQGTKRVIHEIMTIFQGGHTLSQRLRGWVVAITFLLGVLPGYRKYPLQDPYRQLLEVWTRAATTDTLGSSPIPCIWNVLFLHLWFQFSLLCSPNAWSSPYPLTIQVSCFICLPPKSIFFPFWENFNHPSLSPYLFDFFKSVDCSVVIL